MREDCLNITNIPIKGYCNKLHGICGIIYIKDCIAYRKGKIRR